MVYLTSVALRRSTVPVPWRGPVYFTYFSIYSQTSLFRAPNPNTPPGNPLDTLDPRVPWIRPCSGSISVVWSYYVDNVWNHQGPKRQVIYRSPRLLHLNLFENLNYTSKYEKWKSLLTWECTCMSLRSEGRYILSWGKGKRRSHFWDEEFHVIFAVTPSLFSNKSNMICNVSSVCVYLVFSCKSQRTEMPERYSSPFHSRTFPITENIKPVSNVFSFVAIISDVATTLNKSRRGSKEWAEWNTSCTKGVPACNLL